MKMIKDIAIGAGGLGSSLKLIKSNQYRHRLSIVATFLRNLVVYAIIAAEMGPLLITHPDVVIPQAVFLKFGWMNHEAILNDSEFLNL